MSEETTPPDPFDPANLRLDQSFIESAGVRKLLTTVPIGKPNPQDFVRVHPDPSYRVPLGLIDLKDDREIYLVVPNLTGELAGELTLSRRSRKTTCVCWPCGAGPGRTMSKRHSSTTVPRTLSPWSGCCRRWSRTSIYRTPYYGAGTWLLLLPWKRMVSR